MPENPSKKMVKHCLGQVGRLAGQDFFKADEKVLEDLAKALAIAADSEEHATMMIDRWKSQTRQMLHESNLRALADATANRGELPRACSRCMGADFIVVEVEEVTAVKRCSCPRGRKLQQWDNERAGRARHPLNDPTTPNLDEVLNQMPVDREWKQ